MKRDFYWYEVLSRKMLDIVGSFFPSLEYYSIDEFFFRATPVTRGQSLCHAATSVRDHIRETANLPVTIGVARTRTLAKLFSDTAKPFGAVVVTDRDHEHALLAQLPVTEISGIAGRRAARLAPYGIRTCLDLADADGRLVKKLLTKTGHELWTELNGLPVTPMATNAPSMSNEIEFRRGINLPSPPKEQSTVQPAPTGATVDPCGVNSHRYVIWNMAQKSESKLA